MPIQIIKHENAGHPWVGRPGFDHLELQADTEADLTVLVDAATRKFWQPWLIGTCGDGTPGGVLYQPSGFREVWADSLSHPHPGAVTGAP